MRQAGGNVGTLHKLIKRMWKGECECIQMWTSPSILINTDRLWPSGALPTSPQPVHLSLCHPASARWPRCLPENKNLWSPSLAGGSAAAACPWCQCQHTDTPGSEPPSPAACRGWDSGYRHSEPASLSDITHGYIISYTALHRVNITTLQVSKSTTGWGLFFCITSIERVNYLGVVGQNLSPFSGSLVATKGFSMTTEKIIRNNFVQVYLVCVFLPNFRLLNILLKFVFFIFGAAWLSFDKNQSSDFLSLMWWYSRTQNGSV